MFDVDSMLFSHSSKCLALVGERGISVLEMPMRWGKFAEYDGGSKSVTCRYIIDRVLSQRNFIKFVNSRAHFNWVF